VRINSKLILFIYPGALTASAGGSARALAMAQAIKNFNFNLILVSRDPNKQQVNDLSIFNDMH
jgi:hypothetical protein